MTSYEQYLEKYCTKHECSVEVAKTHALCKEVEKYYQNPASYAVSVAKICFMMGKEPELVDFVIRKIKKEGE